MTSPDQLRALAERLNTWSSNENYPRVHHQDTMREAAAALTEAAGELDEYREGGHAQAHRCEYDQGHYLHGMPSLCVPCRVELEKRAEAAERRVAELEAWQGDARQTWNDDIRRLGHEKLAVEARLQAIEAAAREVMATKNLSWHPLSCLKSSAHRNKGTCTCGIDTLAALLDQAPEEP